MFAVDFEAKNPCDPLDLPTGPKEEEVSQELTWSMVISCTGLSVFLASQNHNCLSDCLEKPIVASSGLGPRNVTRAPFDPS